MAIVLIGVLVLALIPKQQTIDLNYNVKLADYNDKITLNYELTVDGNVLESSFDTNRPLSFVIGAGNMIKGFEQGVLGLTEGQEKIITVSPEDGYGLANDYKYVYQNDLNEVLNAIKQQTGNDVNAQYIQKGSFQDLMGRACIFDGYDLNKNIQTIKCAHKLAGKTLTFRVKIIKIEKPGELILTNKDQNFDVNKDLNKA